MLNFNTIMFQCKISLLPLRVFAVLITFAFAANGQTTFKAIALPPQLRDINQEFSGMEQLAGRVYLLPQYGSNKQSGLNGDFNIYSFRGDSINRVINGTDTALTAFRTLKVKNLNKLPAAVKQVYQGFETLTFVGKYAYIAIETIDTASNCYIIRGVIDTLKNEISIDPERCLGLKRPFFIANAGFESIAWLPQVKKLIAFYEFNAAAGNTAYLIDTSLTKAPEPVKTPFLHFRNTDAVTAPDGGIYAINYYWNGEYTEYLDNTMLKNAEPGIKRAIPSLKDSLNNNPAYLKSNTFARIIYLKNYRKGTWKQVVAFDGFRNNWEGITLFGKGALIVSDANRNEKQVTSLAYVEF